METLKSFFTDNSFPSHAKVGIYGNAGTGKTRVAFEIISGLIKDHKLSKPVLFYDTEKGSDWVLPLFKKENIECYVKKSRTFSDLMTAVEVAEKESCCLIVDSISHVWRELMQSYLDKVNEDRLSFLIKKYSKEWAEKNFKKSIKLEFQHWNVIKPTWAQFTDRFLNSSLHMIVCGRAGDMYEFQENESGKKELIKSGTRMATEKELSYEPSLLIELQRRTSNGENKLYAIIEKDRADKINGKEFELVKYSDLKPHFDILNFSENQKEVDLYKNKSNGIFEGKTLNPEDDFAQERKQKEIFSEEIKNLIVLKYPGMDAESKKQKLLLIESVFSTTSWAKIETLPSSVLEKGLNSLRAKIKNI